MNKGIKTLRITPEVLFLLMSETPRRVASPLPGDVRIVQREFNFHGDLVLTLASDSWPSIGANDRVPEVDPPVFTR